MVAIPQLLQVVRAPDARHGLVVALRAGGATLAIAGLAHLMAPAIAPLVTMAAGVGIAVFELSRVRATVMRRLDELAGDVAQTQPLLALPQQLPLRRPLPAMQGYAIAPDCALLLAELIAEREPALVVETGSGVSTLVIAYALQKLGRGRVVALEHDPAYARRTRAEIACHGLGAYATVLDAPLEPIAIGTERYRWYATRALDGLAPIDLVVDDGPPRCAGDMLRYASLPVLGPRMAHNGVFVLDVVGDEERVILERWKTELPGFVQEHLATKKGNVILRRR